ncbi:hypothetical protein CAEBREN_14228 [Caenorhabditis brenneri]|uniref:Domain of unknown function DB domain-containing protein n=1 Tax=Caenorhabditis brenneri TaxID=135651 RepID=G0N4J0_CAEBE|nr:hypothetical protein CAEBREN_14228 [Caenorhabditis brenneri]
MILKIIKFSVTLSQSLVPLLMTGVTQQMGYGWKICGHSKVQLIFKVVLELGFGMHKSWRLQLIVNDKLRMLMRVNNKHSMRNKYGSSQYCKMCCTELKLHNLKCFQRFDGTIAMKVDQKISTSFCTLTTELCSAELQMCFQPDIKPYQTSSDESRTMCQVRQSDAQRF